MVGRVAVVNSVWDEAEPPLMRFLLKVLLQISLVAATPFFALTLLFFYLQKPLLWMAIPASIGLLIVVAGLVLWLVVRAKLRGLRERLAWAERAEDAILTGP